jgi:hypothetical protein
MTARFFDFKSVTLVHIDADAPPWFQFLDRHRTQFEFTDYDHIRRVLLDPLSRTPWHSFDAS